MLRRLLQAEKIPAEKARRQNVQRSGKTGFLDLPPELRNVVYDLHVDGVTLTLKNTKLAPTPSMLLVCRQVRAEYQPILLTQAKIVANVYNYDFRNISRMSSSLYIGQMKLLRLNERMIIKLHCLRCRGQDLDSLRRWLVQRADSLDRLPWTYEIGWPGASIALSAKPGMLIGHLEMLLEMKHRMRLDERLDWELVPVCHGLEKELGEVQQQLANKIA